MSTAKTLRLSRILDARSRRSLIVPIDHGMTLGPLPGIETVRAMTEWITHPAINAVIAHKGIAARLVDRGALQGKGLVIHLNGMTSLSRGADDKAMLTSVDAAARLGADGVSLQVNFTGDNDRANWEMLSRVADEAAAAGLVLTTMLYDKAPVENRTEGTLRMKHLLRTAVELGSDALKIAMPKDRFDLGDVLESVHEDAMVFVAGGDLIETAPFLGQVAQALRAGARGVCVGRNIFSRPRPELVLGQLKTILNETGGKFRVVDAKEQVVHGVH